jgi:hypothetical protein
MSKVAKPTDTAREAIAACERTYGLDACWQWRGSKYREMLAAYLDAPVIGNVQRTCESPRCCNPRHLRVMRGSRTVEVTPEMWRANNKGCHVWRGPIVSGIPHLRFTGKNVNVLHVLAARDLQDYRDLQERLVGQRVRNFPRTPVVTRLCGHPNCVNTAHFVVSVRPTGGPARINDYMERERGRGRWFWWDRAEMGDMTFESVNRWRVYHGLSPFQPPVRN